MAVLLCSISASAHDFEVDGIYYNITSETDLTVEVIFQGSSWSQDLHEYTGKVVLPESLVYNGNIYSVTSIGNFAFMGCSNLKSVSIPNSVTSIGAAAFSGCSSLTSISIPNSVTIIGPHAFDGTPWIAKQSDGVIYVNNVLYGYKGEMPTNTSIVVREGTVSLSGDAFFGCSNLTDITIPNSVTSIGSGAFNGCSNLTSITIPNSVTSIENYTFEGCSNLSSITIPNSVTSIGAGAFSGCSSLTSITIPNSVTSIEAMAFNRCSSLKAVYITDLVAWCRINFNSGENPLHYAHHLYLNGKEIKDLIIPNSVTSIGDWAFYGCSGLTKITIPNSVTSIGNYAFQSCSNLTSVTIPNSVTSIGDWAFYGCSNLTSITIPNSVTSIGDRAFYGCSGLTKITIPNSVTSIGDDAFVGTSWEEEQPDGVIYVNDVLYKYKGEMPANTLIEVRKGTVSISPGAFLGCYGLTSITIPNSVMSIGDDTFYKCFDLTSITIPNSVTSIGNSAFSDCSSLTSITIPNSVTSIGNYAFRNCSNLTSITIPNSVTSIGNYAFLNCSNLTSITIPNSVTTIGESAFRRCTSLQSIDISNSVTSIGNYAFENCSQLQEIYFTGVTYPDLGSDIFYLTHSGLLIYVVNKQNAEMAWGSSYSERLVEYINFDRNSFSYNGQIPLVSYTNNLSRYNLTMDISGIQKDAGTYETILKATYSNGLEVDIPYTYTITKAPLTVKANDKTRVYGDEDPQFDVTYIGLKNGETTPVLTSDLNLSTDAVKRSNAGTYEIMVSGGVATNYEFSEYQSGELTVTQAPLTITAQSTVRKYGDENPTFQYAYSGFKNNDTESCLQTLPTVTTAATPFSGIGTYAITPNGATAKNYAITYENGTLTIEKAPLTIRANDVSRMYGDKNPVFTFSYIGFKNGETEENLTAQPLATSASQTNYAGTYDIVPSDAAAKNYAITYENGTLTITKAPLSVTVVSNTKVYGDENPQIELTYTGFRNGDKTNCITSAPTIRTEATALSPVGTYSLTPEGGVAANYEFTEYISGTLTIEKAPLTLVANDASKLYFEENPKFTFHGEGFKNNDTEKVLTVVPNYSCAASRISGAGEYVISPQGASAENYDITYKTGKLTVNKRMLEVSVSSHTRVYNEENPKFELTYKGFVNNETESVLTKQPTVTCEADKTTDVGVYQIIAKEAEAANYQFDYENGTLTIKKAAQEIVWEQDLSNIAQGTQLELTATATSGLAVEYDLADNDIVSIYEANGRIYLDCSKCGSVTIKALQSGNHNYHAALRIYKTLVITNPNGIDTPTVDNLIDVYTLQGVMVKRQIPVENVEEELPAGIYIVNGKKMIVR